LTVWDNVDDKVKWLNDHLATVSTGGLYTLRQLYTRVCPEFGYFSEQAM
jgi:hypothetical protein